MIDSESKRPFLFLSVFLSCIGFVLLILTIVFSILYGFERNKFQEHVTNISTAKDLCLTPYCIKIANYFLDNIDQTVNPCENFYQFSCGKWIENARIPDDDNSQGTFNILEEKVTNRIIDLLTSPLSNESAGIDAIINTRQLYSSCVNVDQIERENADSYIISLINNRLGGWPILQGSNWNPSSFNLPSSLLKLNQFNKFLFFYVATSVDERNSSIHSIYLGQSSLALGDRSYYLNESNITRAYRELIKNVVLLLTNETLTTIDQDVEEIFQVEKRIAQVYWTTAQRYSQTSNRTAFANLSSLLNSSFDYSDYIRRIYRLENIELRSNDMILVRELDVLKSLSNIFEHESSRTLQNYIIWRFVWSLSDHMSTKFQVLKLKFMQIFQGIKTGLPRKIKCANSVNYYMSLAVSKLYIEKYFDESSRQESTEMIDNVQQIFRQMIDRTTWMDAESKGRALEKIDAVGRRIGYPDGLNSNRTYLEHIYYEYKFNSSYFKNVLLINQINLKKIYENFAHQSIETVGHLPLRQMLMLSIVHRTMISVKTAISMFANQTFVSFVLAFTAAILQTPFFDKHAPKYLNYGAIGMVVGHELTHGFDSFGGKYDKHGNRVRWWTNQTIEAFNRQKQCIIDQYSNYTLSQINLNVNGEQTQGENIADNGGLKQAFFAYQKWAEKNKNIDKRLPGLSQYSPEQMFFMNYAQVWCSKVTDQAAKRRVLSNTHSPPEFRVIGPTSNFNEFDRVFGCKPGQRNSRVDKCTVW